MNLSISYIKTYKSKFLIYIKIIITLQLILSVFFNAFQRFCENSS